MPMQYSLFFRWLCTIGCVFLFLALPNAYSRSITLKESLEHAQAHNEALQIAREDLGKSREQIRQTAADAFPQLDLTLQYTRNWLLPSFLFGQEQFTIGAHNNLTTTLGIRQSIFGGGKTLAALRIARLFETFSTETVRATHQQVHTQVETAFYDLMLAEELTRVSQSSVARARANLHRVKKLREAGRVSDYDLLRAQVQVAELTTDSIRVENNRALAELALKNQIGFDSHEPLAVRGTFREKGSTALGDTEEELVDLSKRMLPQMRQQRLELQMRQNAETVTRASSRPSIDLIVNGQWEAQKNNFSFSKNDFRQSWFSGVVIKLPIFDGFRTGAQVGQARSDTRRALLVQKQIERDVRLNVLQSWQNLREAKARKESQKQAVDLAHRGMKIAESRYEGGVGTQLEVIDAQLTLQRAQAEFASAQRDLAVALVLLERSTGILGEPNANKDDQ